MPYGVRAFVARCSPSLNRAKSATSVATGGRGGSAAAGGGAAGAGAVSVRVEAITGIGRGDGDQGRAGRRRRTRTRETSGNLDTAEPLACHPEARPDEPDARTDVRRAE